MGVTPNRSRKSSLPDLTNAGDINLTELEKTLIQNVHRNYKKIIVEKEFKGGYSGTRVFLVSPLESGGASDARVVTKIGPKSELREEKNKYDKFVKRALPYTATQVWDCYEQGDWAALNYVFAGDGILGKTPSLEEYYKTHSAVEVKTTLDSLLGKELGPRWYGQFKQQLNGFFREEYGQHLPLHAELEKIVKVIFQNMSPAEDGDRIKIPGVTETYPHPLKIYLGLLNKRLKGWRSLVHGDLHPRNVLVDESGKGWLIDFAKVTERHNLFDFIRLETYLRLMVLAPESGAFSWNDYIQFELALNADTLGRNATPPTNPSLAKAYTVIQTIRRIARKYMGSEPDFRNEYFPALFLYCLAMLKYYFSHGAVPTQLVFITACSLTVDIFDERETMPIISGESQNLVTTQPTVPSQIRVETKRVELVLEGEFKEFTSNRQQDIVDVLAALLRIDPVNIRVLKVSEGSIVITMEMPYSAANHLYEIATKSDFRLISMGIKSIMVDDRKIIELGDKTALISDNRLDASARSTKAVRSGGISIGGNATGNVIVNGNDNKVNQTNRKLHTGGGAYVAGDVHVQNGDFVGRDKVDNSIKVGDIHNASGFAIGHGAQVNLTQNTGASADEIARAFALIMAEVDQEKDSARKEKAQKLVRKLEAEARKGEQADEDNVEGWFTVLAKTSADAWDVAVATLSNPIAGIGLVFQKIVQRAKEEKAQRGRN